MDKLNVIVSLLTEQNDYPREQAASAQTAAAEIGAGLQISYANNDAVSPKSGELGHLDSTGKARPMRVS